MTLMATRVLSWFGWTHPQMLYVIFWVAGTGQQTDGCIAEHRTYLAVRPQCNWLVRSSSQARCKSSPRKGTFDLWKRIMNFPALPLDKQTAFHCQRHDSSLRRTQGICSIKKVLHLHRSRVLTRDPPWTYNGSFKSLIKSQFDGSRRVPRGDLQNVRSTLQSQRPEPPQACRASPAVIKPVDRLSVASEAALGGIDDSCRLWARREVREHMLIASHSQA